MSFCPSCSLRSVSHLPIPVFPPVFLPSSYRHGQWCINLPAGEEAKCLAVGSHWVAAATSANFLRMFSHTGLPVSEISSRVVQSSRHVPESKGLQNFSRANSARCSLMYACGRNFANAAFDAMMQQVPSPFPMVSLPVVIPLLACSIPSHPIPSHPIPSHPPSCSLTPARPLSSCCLAHRWPWLAVDPSWLFPFMLASRILVVSR